MKRNLGLVFHFARQDLIDRYSGSILGGSWSFIMPLVHILIFVLVFSKIMGAKLAFFGAEFSTYGYSIYLVSGILAWNNFAATVSRTTNIFRDQANLIKKIPVPLSILPLYIIITESVIFFITLGFFVIFLLLIKFPLTWHWLVLPLVFLLQISFSYALGFIFATLSVFIKDIREFVTVMLQIWFWFTPIVYVVTILPDKLQPLFELNPFYQFIQAYRDIIVHHQMPQPEGLLTLLLISILLIVVALKLFKKLERDLRDFI